VLDLLQSDDVGGRRLTDFNLELDLIRFGGRVDYVDLVSSSFVEESVQVLGGIRIGFRCALVSAGERSIVGFGCR
jgi:hypothetical protein